MAVSEIQTGIPIPQDRASYPFRHMKVGQSVLVTGDDREIFNARRAVSFWSKRNGPKFTSRLVDGGLRIWRTA